MSQNMLITHEEALREDSPAYHEFLISYNKNSKCVYGFIEGKDDLSYYRSFVQQLIPSDWGVKLFVAGNKNNVINLHAEFNWTRFPMNQLAFFIDRDLSDFIGFPAHYSPSSNIYITDQYSIENDVVNRTLCERLLTEVCGFSIFPSECVESILDLFEEQQAIFGYHMRLIMAWIIYWQITGKKPNLNNINLKKIFKFRLGKVYIVRKVCTVKCVHEHCSVILETPNQPIQDIIQALSQQELTRYIRGKYLLWFLIEFALSVYKDIKEITSGRHCPPPIHVALSTSNGLIFLAPRAMMPSSLRDFLNRTFVAYINQCAA